MGQIIFNGQRPKYCNLRAIRLGGHHVNDDVALNEIWLVDTTNSTKTETGTGEYDAYIIGDGNLKAGQLPLHCFPKMSDIPTNLSQLTPDTDHQTVSQTEKDLWTAGGTGEITNNVDNEDLTSVEITEDVNVIKFKDKDYNVSTYSGLGKKYLRKNIQTTIDTINAEVPYSELHFREYIDTNQGVGNVCPMTVGSYSTFNYYKTEVKAGDTWVVRGQGGGSPRLWALIDNSTSRIIAAAEVNANGVSNPAVLNIENDCILIVNSINTPATITYRTVAEFSSEKNLLTSTMIANANTRYVIQYDYDLGGETIELPTNSILVFEGGSIKNGILVGNGASIVAPENAKIFDLTLTLSGVWHTQDFYPEWFGAKGDMENDDTPYIQKVLNLSMTDTNSSQIGMVCHLNNRYRVTDTLLIKHDVHILGKSNVSYGKSSNTNGTILADFGEDWKKWVLTTYNRANNSSEILPFNAAHSHTTGYTFMQGGIKVEGIHIQTVTPVYGGLRICGATDSEIENVSIRGVYIGIMRGGNWYSADSKINIYAKLCGYACVAENNSHSLRDAYINNSAPNMDDEGVNWIEYTITENTTILDTDGNEVVLNTGDIVQFGTGNRLYKDNAWITVANNEQFDASFIDGENTINVTYHVESGVGIPWFNLNNRYMAPKWQFDNTILMSVMPKTGFDAKVRYIYAKRSIGFLQSYGNSILSNVAMEKWDTGVYVYSGYLIDESAYREGINACLYLTYYGNIDIKNFVNGAYGDIDGIKRYHILADNYSKIMVRGCPFTKVYQNPNSLGKISVDNVATNEVPAGAFVVRDRKESAYTVTVADTTTTAFSKNIEDALTSEFEHINIPSNKTINYTGAPTLHIGDKLITGGNVNSSVLNFNTSMSFAGRKLTFKNLTININAPIFLIEYYDNSYYNRQIEFIGCKIVVNGTTLITGGNYYYNASLVITGNNYYKGSLVLKDGDNTQSYIATAPTVAATNKENLSLYINPNSTYISTSVVDANGDAVPNTTIYDRVFVSNIRGTNLHLPGFLNYGPTANRPVLTANTGSFMYFDSTLGKPVWWTGSNWTTWDAEQTNYENKTEIVSYSTAPTTITAEDNKYYRIDAAVSNLVITLPAITDSTVTHTIVFSFVTSTTPSVTFVSANNAIINYFNGYSIDSETTYEIIAVFNGLKWIISYGVVA